MDNRVVVIEKNNEWQIPTGVRSSAVANHSLGSSRCF